MRLLNFEEMIESGCYPDEHTYSLLIRGLCREEKLSIACKLWDQMMEKGFILDSSTREILVDTVRRKGTTEGNTKRLS